MWLRNFRTGAHKRSRDLKVTALSTNWPIPCLPKSNSNLAGMWSLDDQRLALWQRTSLNRPEHVAMSSIQSTWMASIVWCHMRLTWACIGYVHVATIHRSRCAFTACQSTCSEIQCTHMATAACTTSQFLGSAYQNKPPNNNKKRVPASTQNVSLRRAT